MRYGVSSFGTLLGQEIAITPLLATTEWEDNWTPTRAEGAIMPSAVNGAAVAWDALGRMESHDGLTIDDWSFDHRLLQVTRAAEGSEPAASERYIYDIHGRPVVLDMLDATGTPVERVIRTWWGDRLVQEQGGGFVRTWWQGLADALPFAYTVSIIPAGGGSGGGGNTGENPPGSSAYPSWLAADDLTFAAAGDHALVEGAEWESKFMLLRNHRGDTVAVVEPNGTFREVYVYGLWGDSTVFGCTPPPGSITNTVVNPCTIPQSNSTLGNSSQFAGTHRSPLTNLYHMGARWYSTSLRQFISRDPLGQAVSFDEWLYTVGDPMNFVDRSGLSPAGVSGQPYMDQSEERRERRASREDRRSNRQSRSSKPGSEPDGPHVSVWDDEGSGFESFDRSPNDDSEWLGSAEPLSIDMFARSQAALDENLLSAWQSLEDDLASVGIDFLLNPDTWLAVQVVAAGSEDFEQSSVLHETIDGSDDVVLGEIFTDNDPLGAPWAAPSPQPDLLPKAHVHSHPSELGRPGFAGRSNRDSRPIFDATVSSSPNLLQIIRYDGPRKTGVAPWTYGGVFVFLRTREGVVGNGVRLPVSDESSWFDATDHQPLEYAEWWAIFQAFDNGNVSSLSTRQRVEAMFIIEQLGLLRNDYARLGVR